MSPGQTKPGPFSILLLQFFICKAEVKLPGKPLVGFWKDERALLLSERSLEWPTSGSFVLSGVSTMQLGCSFLLRLLHQENISRAYRVSPLRSDHAMGYRDVSQHRWWAEHYLAHEIHPDLTVSLNHQPINQQPSMEENKSRRSCDDNSAVVTRAWHNRA